MGILSRRIQLLAVLGAVSVVAGGWGSPARAATVTGSTGNAAMPGAAPLAGVAATSPLPGGVDCEQVRRRLPSLAPQATRTGKTKVACIGTTSTDDATTRHPSTMALSGVCTSSSSQWQWTRFEVCLNYNTYIGMIDVLTEKELGRTYFNLQHRILVEWNSLEIKDDIAITRGTSEGSMDDDDEMTVELATTCAYGCSGSRDTRWIPWDYGESVTFTGTYRSTVASLSQALARLNYAWVFDHEDFLEPSDPWEYNSGDVRCDTSRYKPNGGCSVGYAKLILPHGGLGAVTTHVIVAQSAGKPGKPGGSALQYDPDDGHADTRRQQSCAGFTPNAGEQCDEYPFAHTYQGGTGASVRSVPPGDNASQGGKFSAFVQYQRVLDGEQFWVDPDKS